MTDLAAINVLKIIEGVGAVAVAVILILYGKRMLSWLLVKCYIFFIGSKDHTTPN
jgi:hypothetical protein